MGLFDLLFGGKYNQTVKKNTTPKRLTKEEMKKLVWALHDILDQGQRKKIINACPQNIYGPREFRRFLRRLRQQGSISYFEVQKIWGKFKDYF